MKRSNREKIFSTPRTEWNSNTAKAGQRQARTKSGPLTQFKFFSLFSFHFRRFIVQHEIFLIFNDVRGDDDEL
jgi:hypothetical protein